MSTATFAPTTGAADSVAAARNIRDKAVAAAAWPISLAKRILNALRGGWTEAFKGVKSAKTFLADAVSAIPASVKGFLVSAPFSTEGGYERIRSAAHWLSKKAIALGFKALYIGGMAAAIVVSAPAQLVGMINKNAGEKLHKITNVQPLLNKADAIAMKAYNALNSAVDYVYYTLGHRVAVRTVTTGATGISALVGAEALSILGVSMGLLPTTLSGFIAGTPVLAGLPLVPALLTSAGVVLVSMGTLVAVGGLAAWLFKRAEINDIIKEDAAFAAETAKDKAEAVVVDASTVRAEVDQLIAEATDAKIQAQVAREVINQSRHGGQKRRNK